MYHSRTAMAYSRRDMIEMLQQSGIYSGRVLNAMAEVPRHLFVSEALRYRAYENSSLPIGFGQTISKPYIIALMVQALSLTGQERVLEIGTGSGYQTALLSTLAAGTVSLERIAELHRRALSVLTSLGYGNVRLHHADDFQTINECFDAIVVAAGAPLMPEGLLRKLVPGGRLVIPVEQDGVHVLRRYVACEEDRFFQEEIGTAQFVPYIQGRDAV